MQNKQDIIEEGTMVVFGLFLMVFLFVYPYLFLSQLAS